MPLISSPVAYPPSSSPPPINQSRKRSLFQDLPFPSKRRSLGLEGSTPHFQLPSLVAYEAPPVVSIDDTAATHTGPFLDDDDDDVDDSGLIPRLQAVSPYQETLPTILLPRITTDQLDPYQSIPPAKSSSGKAFRIRLKDVQTQVSYERLIAARSAAAPGKAAKSFYGVDIHHLLDEAVQKYRPGGEKPPAKKSEAVLPSIEISISTNKIGKGKTMLWTEKYRAKKFTDLVGDERTHRDVLRWIKGWDLIVFPGTSRPIPKTKSNGETHEIKPHRKILLLTGPPGLGKTTLAHVCARQAGYEIVEINASDERSRDVVKGKIRDCVGTENVKGVNVKSTGGTTRKAGRPVCVIVDEVDGVVSGSSGGGEGGFIKALIDLVALDQKNSTALSTSSANPVRPKKKGDRFRQLRPMILICNDVYHPALRPLRTSSVAEIIHIRRPPLDKVVARLKSVFEKEGVSCDSDGVRRLCEASWDISSKRESRSNSTGTGEGDLRGILVVGEWVASKLRASSLKSNRLTKRWVEENMLESLSHEGGGARGIGRGGAKEAVERVFLDGAGFAKPTFSVPVYDLSKPKTAEPVGVSQPAKRAAMDRLREIIDTSGESDRIVTDCFATYPSHPFQDDTFLSKPNAAYNWLHFHDRLSSKVHVGQEWELGPYLSQSVLGFHHLFASPAKQSWATDQKRWDDNGEEEPLPFSGPRADYSASEAMKQNKATLLGLQSTLSIPLLRSFKSAEDISTDLLPHLIRMLTPNVKPIVVGGSGDQRGTVSVRKEGEREMIQRAVSVMGAVGVKFERARVESLQGSVSNHIYRMEPPLDTLAAFETASHTGVPPAPARYAIRQALDQEHQKYLLRQQSDARQARYKAGGLLEPDTDLGAVGARNPVVTAKDPKLMAAKRDFFGRIIAEARPSSRDGSGLDEGRAQTNSKQEKEAEGRNVWVSFHEGFSNAVRKPITLEDLMRSF